MIARERGSGARALPTPAYLEGDASAAFLENVSVDRYALDTEFVSGSTYFPKLALIQVATPSAIAIIDPLNQNPSLLTGLLRSKATMVAHAAGNDISILRDHGLPLPSSLLDTQVAAQLLGSHILSLADLAQAVLGIAMNKSQQRRDWTVRPLPRVALDYAVLDVAYLLEIAAVLEKRLYEKSKVSWWYEESALMLNPPTPDPIIRLGPRSSKSIVQRKVALFLWRELIAKDRDIPRRWVVDDETVMAWARSLPGDFPMLSPKEVTQLHAAVAAAPLLPTQIIGRRTKDQKSALVRLRAARDTMATELGVDPPLLATTRDLEGLVDGRSTRLDQGWRREHVLKPLGAVLATPRTQTSVYGAL